ncbi:MAG: type II toxin-antitoxin system VapC family toxin [Candidatus Caldarchaeum sp.]|nr:type II toxin-antitoxin system VapC family toxin [Candidatus Caldarchaeum sp.]
MAGPKTVVVDASVAVKWFNQEQHSTNAVKLLHDYARRRVDLTAPYLIVYEVCNALRYNPEFGETDVAEALRFLAGLQMRFRLLDGDYARRAVSLAYSLGLTFYDAVYVALAEAEEAELYTADEKILTKALSTNVKHIKEYR